MRFFKHENGAESLITYDCSGSDHGDPIRQLTVLATFKAKSVASIHIANDGLFHVANASGSVLCLGRNLTDEEALFLTELL